MFISPHVYLLLVMVQLFFSLISASFTVRHALLRMFIVLRSAIILACVSVTLLAS